MVGPAYNEPCKSCNSRVWIPLDSYELQEGETEWKDGNVHKDRVGHKCAECGHTILTREIPDAHASDDSLDLPASADRDMVHEGDN